LLVACVCTAEMQSIAPEEQSRPCAHFRAHYLVGFWYSVLRLLMAVRHNSRRAHDLSDVDQSGNGIDHQRLV